MPSSVHEGMDSHIGAGPKPGGRSMPPTPVLPRGRHMAVRRSCSVIVKLCWMERGRCNYESEAAHTDVLELGKLLEAVARALSAETRLLDAAEGGELSG